jgi:pimeloyl-ACP methyl ester carboxylesterase
VDPDRVYLTGMSMGGFGTWRLSQLYPDQFARGIVWAGPMTPNSVWTYPSDPPTPSCGRGDPPNCGYNLMDLFGNTRDLPLFVVHGGVDELVPATGAEHWMGEYASRGHATYRYLFYPNRQHETSFPASTEPWVLQWLRGLPARERNPVRVTYRIRREFLQPRFGIAYSRAYWASGLTLAARASQGLIDASRATAPDRSKVLADSVGADDLGPYRLRGSDVSAPPPVRNFVDVHVSGLVHAVLDTRRMGWISTADQRLTGETDTPVDLVLRGDYRVPVTVSGARFARRRGAVTLHLPAGRFEVVIRRIAV